MQRVKAEEKRGVRGGSNSKYLDSKLACTCLQVFFMFRIKGSLAKLKL